MSIPAVYYSERIKDIRRGAHEVRDLTPDQKRWVILHLERLEKLRPLEPRPDPIAHEKKMAVEHEKKMAEWKDENANPIHGQ